MRSATTVAAFMDEARAMLAGGVTEQSLHAVGQRLAQVGREKGFIPAAEMTHMHGGNSVSTILQSDPDGLTLMLARFAPTEETPVHDHNSWGVACVIEGRDRYRHWELGADGNVHVLYEKELGPGSFVTWMHPPRDIHSQQGIDEPAVELVLFGTNVMVIPRRYYDPETGDVRTALPQDF
jgi:predicted metal-dependent enzyme (double-stranded beta helix superfamily)